MGMQTYICGTLPFTALQVNPTMTTSTAEKPGNLKKVHLNFWGGFLGFRLSFNQNIKHYFCICEASVTHFPCVLTSV